MKKLAILFFFQWSILVNAQQIDTVFNSIKHDYEDVSYEVTDRLRLRENFRVRAAVEGEFFGRIQALNVSPAANAAKNENLVLTFNDFIPLTSAQNNIGITGSLSGNISGSWTVSSSTARKLVFNPSSDFIAGEIITIVVSDQLVGTGQYDRWIPQEITVQINVDEYLPIPDVNFELALIAENIDDIQDGFIRKSVAENETSLNIEGSNIQSLQGISYFKNLVTLRCSYNQITQLDVTQNTKIQWLWCEANQIQTLNAFDLPLLSWVKCGFNWAMTSANLTNNPNLSQVEISDNPQLQNLDLTGLSNLVLLNGANSGFTNLNLSGSPLISSVNLEGNYLTTINLGTPSNLTTLNLAGSSLTNLDLSAGTNLTHLDISDNHITNFNLPVSAPIQDIIWQSNGLNTIDVSGYSTLENLDVQASLSLGCIKVSPAQLGTLNVMYSNSSQTFVGTDCATVLIPDSNFEQQLVDKNIDNVMDGEVLVSAIEKVTLLDISGSNIADLTGIEGFASLVDLNVSDNSLSALDLSQNTALQVLRCSNNSIEGLDLSYNTNLSTLECENNALTVLNLNGLTTLTTVKCQNNQISSLDFSGNALLTDVDCRFNQLVSIDLIGTTSLVNLFAESNFLTNLNLSNLPALDYVNVNNNTLVNLDVSGSSNLRSLFCDFNQLSSLNTNGAIALLRLDARYNEISMFDVTSNINLNILDLEGNQLFFLDLNNNSLLSTLDINGSPNIFVCVTTAQLGNIPPGWTVGSFYHDNCSKTNVPDVDFEQALIDTGNDFGIDGYVYNDLVKDVTSLHVPNKSISSLGGIEAFESLTYLNCSQNQLTNIDLTSNQQLQDLYSYSNQLTSLNVSSLTQLRNLQTQNNLLSSIDVLSNPGIDQLNVSGNLLSNLDLGSKPLLYSLKADNNQLLNIDLSDYVTITGLSLSGNSYTTIDLSALTNLTSLFISGTNLTTLDISNITSLTSMDATASPNLSCIQVNPLYEVTQPTGWSKDPTSDYSTDCFPVYVPDDAFEQTLINLGYDDVLDDYVQRNNINTVTFLNVGWSGITDMTGIEGFTMLTELSCNNNLLSTIDISNNNLLEVLRINNNQLTSLDVQSNILLKELHASDNQLQAIDLSSNNALLIGDVGQNAIATIDVSMNPLLTELYVRNTLVTSVDVSGNLSLTNLSVRGNPMLTGLDVTGNTGLKLLDVSQNTINSIDIGNNTLLEHFNSSQTPLVSLDLTNNPLLTYLNCADNELSALDVSHINSLEYFFSTNNDSLTCIDVNAMQLASIPAGWYKDAVTSYSLDCSGSGARVEPEVVLSSEEEIENFKIYPNPTRDLLNIELPEIPTSDTNWVIHDLSGKVVMTGKFEKDVRIDTLKVKDLPSGVYVITVAEEEKILINERFVIEH
ncbi:T9SS type A sorting domain-containing protein [Ekhidna sp.]|uniref:T9SS type A sorting domain-containing protein n=1 Tax=Ekhidna sp. TaxID=2608089 RepID=UPI003299E61F